MPERGVPEGTQYLAHADLTLRNATSKKGTMGGAKQRMRPERYYQEPVTEIITKENKYQDGFAHKEIVHRAKRRLDAVGARHFEPAKIGRSEPSNPPCRK